MKSQNPTKIKPKTLFKYRQRRPMFVLFRGVTLVELLVTVSIFITVLTISAGIFVFGIRTQRKLLANQELSDQAQYALEYMSRAIRLAIKDDLEGTNCLTGNKVNYEITPRQGIKFKNHDGVCQEFYLDGGLLREDKGTAPSVVISDLTSSHLKVSNFNISLSGKDQPPTDYLQPRITLFLKIQGREKTEILTLQTTISQRNLDTVK